jgi:predicted HNH restriction endonuclease
VSGFQQEGGTKYAEAHHIIELHQLIPGSYCSDNIIVVCPTCHRKLHYALVKYDILSEEHVAVEIKGEKFSFTRNILPK